MASAKRKSDSARPLPAFPPAPPFPAPVLPPPQPPPIAPAEPLAPPARLIAAPRLHPEFEALLRSRRDCTRRFGQMVRAVRIRRGLSQSDLADRAHVHRSHISLIEQAARMVRIDTICLLAAGLQVPPAELMPTPLPPVSPAAPLPPVPPPVRR